MLLTEWNKWFLFKSAQIKKCLYLPSTTTLVTSSMFSRRYSCVEMFSRERTTEEQTISDEEVVNNPAAQDQRWYTETPFVPRAPVTYEEKWSLKSEWVLTT